MPQLRGVPQLSHQDISLLNIPGRLMLALLPDTVLALPQRQPVLVFGGGCLALHIRTNEQDPISTGHPLSLLQCPPAMVLLLVLR